MSEKTGFEWPTLLLLIATYAVWAAGTLLWPVSGLLSVVVTGVAVAQFCSLQHEVLHGHPFRNPNLNHALVFPALALVIPYERFRDTHLQHHYDPALTDPYDDPESNYQDPQVWARMPRGTQALLRLNNTLLGRILLGPAIGTRFFIKAEIDLHQKGNPAILHAWMMNGLGILLVLGWLWGVSDMPLLAYAMAAYLGYSLLKIRTYLEHRAHEAPRARTVIIEDRGPLALLFLNNNLHVVHHMHPTVPWYDLPALYAERRAHYQRRNEAYVYRSYAEVFRRYLFKAKDPVPHPVWPVRKADD
ncbi:fatty acid desaturase [Fuscibacter oryzae]|uniref:Fatty acid desaturase n=1 Tax=Fuscibacter oryzae TaxID=2803939 RepID=A0A8J7SV97_9RHOB|nr:fatty acid desaturase [Fuscibacter oryzae]MBL4929297.1 fatty acid desaturase [Fuscibacter oryzae]